MGFLNNIKKILFEEEPDEAVNLPPDYSKEEEVKDKVTITPEEPKEEDNTIKVNITDDSRFKIKRDLEPEFDDEDILDEVEQREEVTEVVEEPKKEEKTNNIFQSFDEKEFEMSYSRVTKNEDRAIEEKKKQEFVDNNIARRANSNISSTNSFESMKKIEEGPKKFKPSPVLSPVFGVLNVNYTKEDIVDRKDGIKRQKVSPIVRKKTEEEIVKEIKVNPDSEKVEVNIDSVRKKAYGAIENLEKAAMEETKEDKKREKRDDFTSVELDKKKKEEPKKEEPKREEPKVEEKKDNFKVEEIIDNSNVEDVVDEHSDIVIDNEEDIEESKPVVLDDLEKTSTLQILDDIEKELNAIKPIQKDELKEVEEEIHDRTPSVENSDTLENDLFNLIDSMYDTGEEEK